MIDKNGHFRPFAPAGVAPLTGHLGGLWARLKYKSDTLNEEQRSMSAHKDKPKLTSYDPRHLARAMFVSAKLLEFAP